MAYQVNYSTLDRLLHRLAFSSPTVQFTAADIEKTVLSTKYKKINSKKPIFITSLPRAGTTLFLEVLNQLPFMASHVYRDMPFIMAPVLWNRINNAFRKQSQLKERAHGDGMKVSYDSPEAFEEILWRAHWPEKYSSTSIKLWGRDDEQQEATAFFTEHFKKIILLRCPIEKGNGRYISKNNGNIARLELIPRMFPDAKILVPVRDPFEHAMSLLRQHQNFTKLHQSEPFVRRYMEDIGHYEFGELHRPIAFPGLDELICQWDPITINYWVAYWITAFEYVMSHRESVILISYEKTCTSADTEFPKICAQLEIKHEDLHDIAKTFRSPPAKQIDPMTVDASLRDRAQELYQQLVKY